MRHSGESGMRARVAKALRQLSAWPLWRRVGTKRGAVGIALFALLVAAALGTVGLTVRAFQPAVKQQSARSQRPDPKAEGQWFQLSHFGKSHPAPDARAKALTKAANLPLSPLGGKATPVSGVGNSSVTTSPGSWAGLGPEPITTSLCDSTLNCTNYGFNSGRITAVAVDPNGSDDVWVGAADGGVWHSTDGGSSWTPITDTQSTLSIGSITIDATTTPHTIWVGTGEANFSGDAYPGNGILKIQVNGGVPTVTPLASSYFAGLSIGKLSVLDPDPNNGNNATLLAAVSFDGIAVPAGGNSYLSHTGIWRSTNGGTTWSRSSRTSRPPAAVGASTRIWAPTLSSILPIQVQPTRPWPTRSDTIVATPADQESTPALIVGRHGRS